MCSISSSDALRLLRPTRIYTLLQLRHNDVKHLLNIVAKWLHRLSLIIPLQFELPVTL